MNYVGNQPAPSGLVLVGDTNPIGTIIWTHAPPDGSYLRLNGQAVAKATYPDLWLWAQGFLTGDQVANPGLYRNVDANTFAVPIFDGLFIRGVGGLSAALGVKQASDNLQHLHLITDPGHKHQVNAGAPANPSGAGPSFPTFNATDTTVNVTGITIQNAGGAEARPTNVALVPCVKAISTILIPQAAMPVIPPGDVVKLYDKVFAAAAQVDFIGLAGYASYRFILDNVVPSVSAALLLRVSTDNGATFDAADKYGWQASGLQNGAVVSASQQVAVAGANAIQLATPVNAAPGHGVSGEVVTNAPATVGGIPYFFYSMGWWHNAGYMAQWDGAGLYINSSVNAVRFLSGPGTITGRIRCYGLR